MKMKGDTAIVSLSGGMDSVTLLAYVLAEGFTAQAVGFTYGSKHNSYENYAARQVAQHYNVPFDIIDLSTITKHLQSDLLLTGGDIPEGHYEAKSMERTVVPGRNIIFASILAGIAWSRGASSIWLGVHAGDHAIYPDCRRDFLEAMDKAIRYGTDKRVEIEAPFLHMDKVGILNIGLPLKVPYELTRTCYKDQATACGKCGSCQERLTAFAAVRTEDPVPYDSREILPRETS